MTTSDYSPKIKSMKIVQFVGLLLIDATVAAGTGRLLGNESGAVLFLLFVAGSVWVVFFKKSRE
jgi:hypothetical protein